MLFGTAQEGLHVVSKALATDPVIDSAKYTAGMDQWQARGYGLTHGRGGYGYYGLPLPWGETPEIDYFLQGQPARRGRAQSRPAAAHADAQRYSVALDAAFGNVTIGQTSAAKTIVDLEQRHRGCHQHVVSGRACEIRQVRYVQR